MIKTTTTKGYMQEQKGKFKAIAVAALLLVTVNTNSDAQDKTISRRDETYGHTLNLGLGIGYYGYLYQSVPFFFANYEFDVARSFTLAPFIGIASYRSENYYIYAGDHYFYHETVIPMGLKGTYYFDRILGAGPRWDFYLAASVGFNYDRVVWDNGYYGDRGVSRGASTLYLDGHIGTEYHLNRNLGLFLDLSTGVSTIGLAVHRL